MLAAARQAGKPLAVGHFRRFVPSLGLIRDWILNQRLGAVRYVEVSEGGPFDWPAATASFFDRKTAGGGVFLDVGTHVIDVLLWWLGEPCQCSYRDDASGGLEINAEANLKWERGITARVRLSRDWTTPGVTRIFCDTGELRWRFADTDQVEFIPEGGALQFLKAAEETGRVPGWLPPRAPGGWRTANGAQLLEFVEVARGNRAPTVSGEDGLRTVAWIERCYGVREYWQQPWLDASENDAAARLSAAQRKE
jgi:predicted dehydrogenase